MDVAPWCYKWIGLDGWDRSLGGLRYRAPLTVPKTRQRRMQHGAAISGIGYGMELDLWVGRGTEHLMVPILPPIAKPDVIKPNREQLCHSSV